VWCESGLLAPQQVGGIETADALRCRGRTRRGSGLEARVLETGPEQEAALKDNVSVLWTDHITFKACRR
jgi:hypothetical protein